MAEANIEELSERERECLEHLRQAKELGEGFREYCRTFELDWSSWYAVRKTLVRKGVIAGRARASARAVAAPVPSDAEPEEQRAGFIPVRLAAPTAPQAAAVACCLRHTSGWSIECAELPQIGWLKALMENVSA